MPSSVSTLLYYVFSGVLMGTAEVIPGVSGGTMALIVGVYERLVDALSSFVSLGLSLLRGDLDAVRSHWSDVPWPLLWPLAVGMFAALGLGARIIPGLLEAYPAQMRGLFLGLVGGSLVIPALRIRRITPLRVGLGLVSAVGAFFLTGLPVFGVADPSLLRVFASAAVAICAMILPGVSGAFLLEAMGLYAPTLEALNNFEVAYVLTFVAGAAVGLGSFAKLLDWLLTHRHDATMAILVGLIAGALRALWPYRSAERTLRLPSPDDPVLPVVGLALLGLGLVLGLLWWGHRRSTPAPHPTG